MSDPLVWGFAADVLPDSDPDNTAAQGRYALEQLLASLAAEGLEPIAKPRLQFAQGRPEMLREGEVLVHKWLASVHVRRRDADA